MEIKSKHLPIIIIALVVVFTSGIMAGNIINAARANIRPVNSNEYIDNEYVSNVLQVIRDNYLGDMPDKTSMTLSVVQGLVESLGDRYTVFMRPEEAKAYNQSASNSFQGIGITLSQNGENAMVESVIPGLPAEKAGLLPGDVIVEVGGENVTGMSYSKVAELIRGEVNTTVNLKLLRDQTIVDFAVVRAFIDLPNIEFKMTNDGYALIKIIRFTDNDLAEFKRSWDGIVSQVVSHNPKGVIMDLRNNPGGYVEGVRYVAEEFLRSQQIIYSEKTKQGRVLDYPDNRTGRLENYKLAVLVNNGSASASEIFAAAIKDNARGKVMGIATVGKGVEQRVIDFTDGSMLLVVYRRWLTPKGNNLGEGAPLQPEIEVADEVVNTDALIDKAKELLSSAQ